MPFARGPRADACGSCGGLRRLPALDLPRNQLSTMPRQTGILMDVHPVLRGIVEVSQLQHPRSGPDGQPIESPHLGKPGEGPDASGTTAPAGPSASSLDQRSPRETRAFLRLAPGPSPCLPKLASSLRQAALSQRGEGAFAAPTVPIMARRCVHPIALSGGGTRPTRARPALTEAWRRRCWPVEFSYFRKWILGLRNGAGTRNPGSVGIHRASCPIRTGGGRPFGHRSRTARDRSASRPLASVTSFRPSPGGGMQPCEAR